MIPLRTQVSDQSNWFLSTESKIDFGIWTVDVHFILLNWANYSYIFTILLQMSKQIFLGIYSLWLMTTVSEDMGIDNNRSIFGNFEMTKVIKIMSTDVASLYKKWLMIINFVGCWVLLVYWLLSLKNIYLVTWSIQVAEDQIPQG